MVQGSGDNVIDIRSRVARLQELLRFLDGPPGWEAEYVVNEGEIPWWRIKGLGESAKAQRRQWQRMYCRLYPDAQTELIRKTKEKYPNAVIESTRRHREKYPERNAETIRQYNRRHPGALAEKLRRYYRTPKGRTTRARMSASRRTHSTNPELYAARVQQLHTMRESCAICGTPYNHTHQVDHIVALCLDGTDDWENLQPACILCHRKKTSVDLRISFAWFAIVHGDTSFNRHPIDISTIDPRIIKSLERRLEARREEEACPNGD